MSVFMYLANISIVAAIVLLRRRFVILGLCLGDNFREVELHFRQSLSDPRDCCLGEVLVLVPTSKISSFAD